MFLDPMMVVSAVNSLFVCFPLGRGLAAILPTRRFNAFGYIWSLNPGPFSIKEHVCITIMVSSTSLGPYSADVIQAQRVFYDQTTPMAFLILLAIGSQCIGFCFAGIIRQFVVWPSNMIWPSALSTCALFNTIHKNYRNSNQGYMTRERFFCIATVGSFIWYWVSGYLFTGLSMFNWVCWIAPKNVIINTLFGTSTGLGMSVLSFDWAMISSLNNPLITPVGCMSFLWLVHYSHQIIYSGGPK
jgi:OPT family oligopeptide transporter